MTKLEQLIQELCPDGVEFKMLGEIGNVSMCKRILKHETSEIGDVPFYKIGTFGKEANAFISFETYEKYKRLYSFPKKGEVLISASGTIGRTVIFDGEPAYFQDSNIVWISNDETQVTNLFLYYFYQTKPWQVSSGGTIARLYNDNILRTKIPVPPLEVQAEIVRILDKFTELTTELTTELANRKKQYEYYKEHLFQFTNQVNWIELSKVCTIKGRIGFRGYTKKDIVKKGEGAISLTPANIVNHSITYKNNTYISWSKYEESPEIMTYENDIIFCKTGSTIGKTAIVRNLKEKATINPQMVVLKNIRCDFKYLFYILTSVAFQKEVNRLKGLGSVPTISQKDLGTIKIPVPRIEVQKRIATILDRFDKLCNDISEGLPAEIEARQKQYEYYRDKLLTFKEL